MHTESKCWVEIHLDQSISLGLEVDGKCDGPTHLPLAEARASDGGAAVALPAKRKKRRGGESSSFFDDGSSSIRTAATRDRNSPALSSPRIPKVHNIPIDVDLAGNSNASEDAPPKVKPKKFKYRVPLKLTKKSEGIKGGSDPHNESAEVEAILAGLEGMGGKERVMLQTGAYLEAARAINRCGSH